ncbi:hypothetical protein D081_1808 [Anaerovibrio sp. JC8]|uniref:hypothetical protein n=1 Tax=Anaerovibrio sp. JC8 TaxID=1240085 RepID=UPI000A0B5939|nr:hypothetical protein [Anaerovibrio sp. JC8]ORT99658.1 hypothetical protein D081_1808 [Anaerovibrio sp. JC8]
MTYNPFQKIKSAENYSEKEILELLESASNSYLYDYLIDRLYFYRPNKKNNTVKDYSILTARQYMDRLKREKKISEKCT